MNGYNSLLKTMGWIFVITCIVGVVFLLPRVCSAFYCPPRPDIEDKYVLQKLSQAIYIFSIETGKFPVELTDLCDIFKIAAINIRAIPTKNFGPLFDSSDNPVFYDYFENGFLLVASGRDKIPMTEDDISIKGNSLVPKTKTINGKTQPEDVK